MEESPNDPLPGAERAWGKMGEMVWKLDGRDVIDFPQVLHLVGDFVPIF